MPTGFDNFTTAAARTNENANAKYLEKVMVKYGFKPLVTEWWHFDDLETYEPTDSAQVVDITISAIGDVTLGQDERFLYAGGFNEYYDKYGASYFFEGVKKILSEDRFCIRGQFKPLAKRNGSFPPDL